MRRRFCRAARYLVTAGHLISFPRPSRHIQTRSGAAESPTSRSGVGSFTWWRSLIGRAQRCCRGRPLSRGQPGDGVAARRFRRLMERSSRALVAALWPLSVGHLLAMLVVLLPFGLLVTLVEWQQQIQIGASVLVIGFGIFRLVNRRHPRALARIRPTQLGLWSFAVAIAHGAGLMLVPISAGPPNSTEATRRQAPSSTPISARPSWSPLSTLSR